jgi:hypothetical protein
MRLLILGSADDATVRGIIQRMLARHGAGAICFRSFNDLAHAVWEHRVGGLGVHSGLRFRDGSTLADFVPNLVLNRLIFDAQALFAYWPEVDRNYARVELYALLLSFLHGFTCPVVNQPDPTGLAGAVLRPLVWCARAAASGLPTHDTGATTSTRRFPPSPSAQSRPELMPAVDEEACGRIGLDRPLGYAEAAEAMQDLVVIGDRVVGRVAPELHAACLRLAGSVGAELLGIRLARMAGDPAWRFVAADPLAAMDSEREQIVLVDWLEARAR